MAYELDRYGIWQGFRKLLPVSLFVAIFGAAFGLAATQSGLDGFSIVLMSTLVFAGAAQFAVLDLWGAHVPLVPLAITVFAINARHLLMGATLHPWLRDLSPAQRYGVMLVVSDANWAMSIQAFGRGESAMGLLLGGGLALWLSWVLGSGLGLYFGNAIHDPVDLGLDMVMGCFLLAMAVGGQKDLRMSVIWAVAACASLMAWRYLPDNSHVVAGALTGGADRASGAAGCGWRSRCPPGAAGHGRDHAGAEETPAGHCGRHRCRGLSPAVVCARRLTPARSPAWRGLIGATKRLPAAHPGRVPGGPRGRRPADGRRHTGRLLRPAVRSRGG